MLEFVLHGIAFIALAGIGWKVASHFVELPENR